MKALLVLLAISGSALADDRALLHCRTIAEVAARVTCYDAIPVAGGAQAGAPNAAAAAGQVGTAAPRAAAAGPVAPVGAPAPAPAPAAVTGDAAFGMNTIAKQSKSAEPSSIESTVVGTIEGWGPTTQFKLANGQVWRVVDGSSEWFMERTNPKVVLTRNAIGTIFFEVDGARQPPRVRRVQ